MATLYIRRLSLLSVSLSLSSVLVFVSFYLYLPLLLFFSSSFSSFIIILFFFLFVICFVSLIPLLSVDLFLFHFLYLHLHQATPPLFLFLLPLSYRCQYNACKTLLKQTKVLPHFPLPRSLLAHSIFLVYFCLRISSILSSFGLPENNHRLIHVPPSHLFSAIPERRVGECRCSVTGFHFIIQLFLRHRDYISFFPGWDRLRVF